MRQKSGQVWVRTQTRGKLARSPESPGIAPTASGGMSGDLESERVTARSRLSHATNGPTEGFNRGIRPPAPQNGKQSPTSRLRLLPSGATPHQLPQVSWRCGKERPTACLAAGFTQSAQKASRTPRAKGLSQNFGTSVRQLFVLTPYSAGIGSTRGPALPKVCRVHPAGDPPCPIRHLQWGGPRSNFRRLGTALIGR